MWHLVFSLVVIVTAWPAAASEPRSMSAKREFTRTNPCPVTGKHTRRCNGYIVDHLVPLCAGGADLATNMQWQTILDAKIKDREERQQCRYRADR